MFWHNFKYNFLITIRDREQIFWSLIFVIILGTMFQSTFGSAYEKSELLTNLEVVAYIEDEYVEENFKNIIENISLDEENGEKLLKVTYAENLEEASKVLDEDTTVGMFYSENGELKLKVKDTGIAESVLSSIVSQYHQIITVMADVADKAPEVQAQVMIRLMSENDSNIEKTLSDGNMDPYAQYFYNLIAMSCLFASFSGLGLAVKNQANLSSLGARKNVAGSNGFVNIFPGLVAQWLILSVLTIISLVYLIIVGVDFSNKIGPMLLVIFVATFLGISSGFFIGSIGKLSHSVKEAITVAYSLISCFLSGLMIHGMRMTVEKICPVINDINPAVMISDSFYALEIYDTYDRFIGNIIAMLILSVIFMAGGIILGRRKQYASL